MIVESLKSILPPQPDKEFVSDKNHITKLPPEHSEKFSNPSDKHYETKHKVSQKEDADSLDSENMEEPSPSIERYTSRRDCKTMSQIKIKSPLPLIVHL